MTDLARDPHRPVIRVLVCKELGVLVRAELETVLTSRLIGLEDAPMYHVAGWAVFVDPDDEQALATYEREQRSQ